MRPARWAWVALLVAGCGEPPLGAQWIAGKVPPGLFLAGILFALVAATVEVVNEARRENRSGTRGMLALAATGLLAFGVRWLVSPRSIMHEGFHADLLDNWLEAWDEGTSYGAAGPTFYSLTTLVTGDKPEAVFFGNLALASLTAPAVGALDLALFRRWPRAIAAGVIAGLIPVHWIFSASEDLSIPFALFLAWSCALAVRWSERPSLAASIALATGLALTVQSRPEGLFAIGVVGGLALGMRPLDRARARASVVVALASLVAIVPRMVAPLSQGSAPIEWRDRPWKVFVTDPHAMPTALMAFVLVGAIALHREKGWRLTAWWVLSAATFVTFSNLFQIDLPLVNWRSQVVLVPIAALLAAGGVEAAAAFERAKGRAPAITTGVLVLAVAGALWTGVRGIPTGDQQEEFAFLRKAAVKLPEKARVLAVVGSGRDVWGAFPRIVLDAVGRNVELIDLADADAKGTWPDPAGGLLYYESMLCHTASPSAKPTPEHPLCTRVREHYRLEPVDVHEVSSGSYSSMQALPKPWTIGFHRALAKAP